MTEQELPYGHGGDPTQGWSGSDTSHERAQRERDEGTVARRQRETLATLGQAGARGLTWRELGVERRWHHGQASSVLSVLHMVGRIARLAERRDRCHVYVLPEYVNDRPIQPHGGRRREPVQSDSSAEEKLAAIRALCEEYALLDPGQVLAIIDEGTRKEE